MKKDNTMNKTMTVEQLRVEIFPDRDALGKQAARDAAEKLRNIIRTKGTANAVFAAAPSQNEFLEYLRHEDIPFDKIRAFHMDEYIGLPPDHPAGFANFLKRALFGHIDFMEVHYMGGTDASAVLAEYTRLLEQEAPDIIFLGVGENGHLAFNDPPVADFKDPLKVKIVDLDLACRQQQVNDGCFASLDDVPEQAITLTMSQIIAVPAALVIVPGERKAPAVRAMLKGPVSTACPASILRRHNHAALYLDNDSASAL